ncbi:hypothetical protein NYP18_09185 [Corynebacterium sp. YIM 101645]|uniref:10 kDa chaperonin n=1 Tax=Corynebacterium lemuris TaxID=1859292 RepID=A0ABT2FX68_9CORY|nr:hypothetical protein [Corynebacterium lemuris]MCS5479832.1 hypothetical protein [Corynebacterium lemuris]
MSETINVLGRESKDRDGHLVFTPDHREIPGCVVDIDGQSKVQGEDVPDGNTDRLRVLAPAGTVLQVGDIVRVRGEEYTVQYAPFDYSVGRRPVLRRHRPKTLFIVERREA